MKCIKRQAQVIVVMCRLTAYKGSPILIGDVLTKPNNSLLCQSRDARYHPGVVDKTNERNIVVNGDGFGLAWYADPIADSSCCFRFVTPAWSNPNLRNIGDHVRSHLFFGHVRAASSGHDPQEEIIVGIQNCHPFKYGPFTFMHNGGIPSFSKIRLSLLNILSDRSCNMIKGSTDTEHMFALFLDFMPPGSSSVDDMVAALNQTISTIVSMCAMAEIEKPCSLNLSVTNGTDIIATRFRNGPENPPSLYFIYGSRFTCRDDGHFCSVNVKEKDSATDKVGRRASSVVISSAPLSRVSHHVTSTTHLLRRENILSESPLPQKPSLGDVDEEIDLSVPEEDITDEPEHSAGAWTLIPKDFMLICKGDPADPFNVSSISLQPVQLCNPFQCPKTMALFRRRTKEKLLVCKALGTGGSQYKASTQLRSKL